MCTNTVPASPDQPIHIQGDDKDEGRGIIQRCCESLLEAADGQQHTREAPATLHIGILELYLDRVRDLGRVAVDLLDDPAFSSESRGSSLPVPIPPLRCFQHSKTCWCLKTLQFDAATYES
jgi:hypothetical protein